MILPIEFPASPLRHLPFDHIAIGTGPSRRLVAQLRHLGQVVLGQRPPAALRQGGHGLEQGLSLVSRESKGASFLFTPLDYGFAVEPTVGPQLEGCPSGDALAGLAQKPQRIPRGVGTTAPQMAEEQFPLLGPKRAQGMITKLAIVRFG